MKTLNSGNMISASEQAKLDKETILSKTTTKQKKEFKSGLLNPCNFGIHNPNFDPNKSML